MAPRAASSAGMDWYTQPPFIPEPEYTGSTMVFYQAAAPTGWTQNLSYNNCTLRLVSGLTGGSGGGTTTFTTVYPATTYSDTGSFAGVAGGTSGLTPITSAEIPVHTHPGFVSRYSPYPTGNRVNPSAGAGVGVPTGSVLYYGQGASTSAAAGGSHSHPYPAAPGGTITATQNRNIRYIDVIICSKNP